jgi:hypothetical protein
MRPTLCTLERVSSEPSMLCIPHTDSVIRRCRGDVCAMNEDVTNMLLECSIISSRISMDGEIIRDEA